MTDNIDGIVLAAGASSRMGSSKALLEIDGTTFLERAVHTLREAGCRYVVAVVNDDDWVERLADVSGAAVIINDKDDSEQIESLQLGLANLPEDSRAAVVLPVDYPRVNVETVRQLIHEFTNGAARILNPSYNGEAGHPVVFGSELYSDLLAPHGPDGARSIIEEHQREARTIAVDDEGVLIDVDTRADYDKHIKRS